MSPWRMSREVPSGCQSSAGRHLGKSLSTCGSVVWLEDKSIFLCPLAELGFLRISTNKKAMNAPMQKARELLDRFSTERKAERIPDDLVPLDSHPKTSEEVTDLYLADLASRHGAKLATLDEGINHSAVEVVSLPKKTQGQLPT